MSVSIPVNVYMPFKGNYFVLTHHDMKLPGYRYESLPNCITDRLKEPNSRLEIHSNKDEAYMFIVSYHKYNLSVSQFYEIPEFLYKYCKPNKLVFNPVDYPIRIFDEDKEKNMESIPLKVVQKEILELLPYIDEVMVTRKNRVAGLFHNGVIFGAVSPYLKN